MTISRSLVDREYSKFDEIDGETVVKVSTVSGKKTFFRGTIGYEAIVKILGNTNYDRLDVIETDTTESFYYYHAGLLQKIITVVYDMLGGYTISTSSGDKLLQNQGGLILLNQGGGALLL